MFDLNYYDDTISMWVADMDFACPPEVIDAIKKRADRKIFGYTGESSEYHKSIIDWYKRRHDMDIEEEWPAFSNGTVIPTILRETSGLKKIRVSFWKSVRNRIGISPFAMEASIAAYNDSEEWAKQMNEIIDGNLEYMDGFIRMNIACPQKVLAKALERLVKVFG
jgi:bifunctional pyridoxal-dependent enzyme with beta-cystathionase and maltose regulon repressor activities